jgi:hypothetical protein
MGQYYKPVNLDKKEFLLSHDYDNGLKLMEHSWIGNNFVAAVENLIKKGGAWFKCHIVWAGDYADKEPNSEENIYCSLNDDNDVNKIKPISAKDVTLRYLKNLDTKEFVDLKKVPESDGYRIHPLPLLTCEGNGQGGGDYHGTDKKGLIGKWARQRVTIQKSKPKGCKELIFDLTE